MTRPPLRLIVPARHPIPTLLVLAFITLASMDSARDLRPEVDFTSTIPPSEDLDAYRDMLAKIDGIRFSAIYMAHDHASGIGHLRTDEGFDALVVEQGRLTAHLEASLPPGTISHTLSVYEAMRVGNYMLAKIATAGNPPPSAYSVPQDQVTYDAVRDQVREGGSADDVLAKDGSSALLLVFYETRDPIAARAHAAEVERLVAAWGERTSQHPATTGHATTGLLNAAHYVDEVNARETRTWTIVAAIVVLVGLTLVLRGPVNALIAVTTLGAALAWTYGLMAALDVRISFLTLFLAPVVIGIGVDYTVHILQRHEEERVYRSRRDAIAHALARTTMPVLVAGLTTVAGLAAMLLLPAPLFAQIGAVAAVGIGLGILASLTVAPALRAILPQPRPKARHRRDILGDALGRFAGVTSRHPAIATFALACILAGAGAYGWTHTSIGANSVDDELPADDPVARLQREVEQDYGAFERAYLIVRGDLTDPAVLRAIHTATLDASNLTGVRRASSVTQLLLADARTDEGAVDIARTGILGAAGQAGADGSDLPSTRAEAREQLDRLFQDPLWRGIAPFTISEDYTLAIVALTIEPWDDNEELWQIARRIDTAAANLQADLPAEADAHPGGPPINRAAIADNVLENTARVVAGSTIAVLVILLVLWARRGAKGLQAAIAAALVVLGACVLLLASVPLLDAAYNLLHTRGLAPANHAQLTDILLLAFAVTIASGVDDVVVLSHRYWEGRQDGRAPDDARSLAFRTAGRAITATTLVNAAAFAALGGTYFLQSKNLALLTALGILYAYLLTLLVAPLLMRGGPAHAATPARRAGRQGP